MKINELIRGVPKGSQKRAKHATATDDPDKYIGKWEEYTEPQGINSPAGRMMTKTGGKKKKKTEGSIGPLFTRGDTGTGGHGTGAVPPLPIRKPDFKLSASKAPKKFVAKSVKKQNTDTRPEEGATVTEMIRQPIMKDFNADYELMTDVGEDKIGVAKVTSGVIELLATRDDVQGTYKGQLLSRLVQSIVRDADLANANLSIELVAPDDEQMKRFLERFGFRHTGGGIMKRNAGSIVPPSVHDV